MNLKELAESKNKQLFIESYSIANLKVEPIKQATLIESKGKEYKAIGIVKGVPVTRYIENLNGRVYLKKLWENVYKSGMAENTLCLADHPSEDSDGSVKDIVGVWRNFQVQEDISIADLYLVGSHGKLFIEVLEAGGKCGFSTVGFGELKEDNSTVDPETYELVRLSDWVITPSQGVYAEQDHIYTESTNLKQSKNTTNTNHTNYIESIKSNDKRNVNMDKITELTVNNNVKNSIKESKNALNGKGDLVEAKRDLLDTLQYIPEEFGEQRSKLQEQITVVENEIKKTLTESKEKVKLTEKQALELSNKYKIANQASKALKENLNKSGKVLKVLSENEKGMKADIKQLVEDRNNMKADIQVLLRDRKLMESDIKQFVSDRTNMSADLKEFIKERGVLLTNVKTLLEDRTNMLKDIDKLLAENKKLKREMDEYEVSDSEYEDFDSIEVDQFDDEDYSTAVDYSHGYRGIDDDEDFGSLPYDNYEDEDGYLENRRIKSKRKSIKESKQRTNKTKVKVNKDVVSYFNEQVKRKPYLKAIKDKVLQCENLVKAVNFVNKFSKSRQDKPIKISESANSIVNGHYDWVGEGNF